MDKTIHQAEEAIEKRVHRIEETLLRSGDPETEDALKAKHKV